ncbi:hypothetical protein BB559_002510 [Furculomyces boomerangus]|uniref:Rho-GAP domain-containing protein n=1 Tax=Furculomyces boomerangus TaxID=61424 RepID=A0A2T9YUP6_9FUNG|nr:hypothetical protein BB559_002510 [Furculomyces boomerangus]
MDTQNKSSNNNTSDQSEHNLNGSNMLNWLDFNEIASQVESSDLIKPPTSDSHSKHLSTENIDIYTPNDTSFIPISKFNSPKILNENSDLSPFETSPPSTSKSAHNYKVNSTDLSEFSERSKIIYKEFKSIRIKVEKALNTADKQNPNLLISIGIYKKLNSKNLSLKQALSAQNTLDEKLWTLQKSYKDISRLDELLKHQTKNNQKTNRLPLQDKFDTIVPIKIIQIKILLEKYLQRLLANPLINRNSLVSFLSSDILETETPEHNKHISYLLSGRDGYLVRKEKGFTSWKRRYYTCNFEKCTLDCFESPGSALISTINIKNYSVRIIRDLSDSNWHNLDEYTKTSLFNHSFQLEEIDLDSKNSNKQRQKEIIVFWADSEEERDEWVFCLKYISISHTTTPPLDPTEAFQRASLGLHIKQTLSKIKLLLEPNFNSPKIVQPSPGSQTPTQKPTLPSSSRSPSPYTDSPLSNSSKSKNIPSNIITKKTLFNSESGNKAGLSSSEYPPSLSRVSTPILLAVPMSYSSDIDKRSISSNSQSKHSSYNEDYLKLQSTNLENMHSSHLGQSSNPDHQNLLHTGPRGNTHTVSELSDHTNSLASLDTLENGEKILNDTPQLINGFYRDSLGRIVRTQEPDPEIAAETQLVTEDVLGNGIGFISKANDIRNAETALKSRPQSSWGKMMKMKPFKFSKSKKKHNVYGTGLHSGLAISETDQGALSSKESSQGTPSLANQQTSQNIKFTPPVFGAPLDQVAITTMIRENYFLPAVVYRCIEFLDYKNGILEEGIYRVSGSSKTIEFLKNKFNTNCDYNLLACSSNESGDNFSSNSTNFYLDVHAVSSILKSYLRSLPAHIFTKNLYPLFVGLTDNPNESDQIKTAGHLVLALPIANYTLLRALLGHLIRVIKHHKTNRMTLRNIGIVFSPTLGIPISTFCFMIIKYQFIFNVNYTTGEREPTYPDSEKKVLPVVPKQEKKLEDELRNIYI